MLNNITIYTESRQVYRNRETLGISGENGFETLKFNLDTYIDGQGILEIEKQDKEGNVKKYCIELDKSENCYLLKVKSSLLDVVGDVRMQLVIKQEEEEIFKSNIFTLKVKEAINAEETILEQYPSWKEELKAYFKEYIDVEVTQAIEGEY